MKTQSAARGFTLIELSIVVVIVGILATLAVVGYRKLVDSSHTTEGTHMVQAIRVAQESYHAETGRYHNAGWNKFCPSGSTSPPSRVKMPWNPACESGGTGNWAALPVHTDGPVMFGYVTQAGTLTAAGAAPAIPGSLAGGVFTPGTLPTTGDYFLIGAAADISGNGTSGINSVIIGSSFSNELIVLNEGE
jgi:type IV pilus assembly protein PilA